MIGTGSSYDRGKAPSDMTSLAFISFNSTDRALSLSAGVDHTCALFSTQGGATGRIRCWGLGTHGQLGTDDTKPVGLKLSDMTSLGYIVFSDSISAEQVSAGLDHTCAAFANGKTRCWGYGKTGALGYDSTSTLGNGSIPMTKIGYHEYPGTPLPSMTPQSQTPMPSLMPSPMLSPETSAVAPEAQVLMHPASRTNHAVIILSVVGAALATGLALIVFFVRRCGFYAPKNKESPRAIWRDPSYDVI